MSQISGEAVPSYRHQVSVAPTNLRPVKSDFTNGMSRRVESDRAKQEVKVGRVILFKDYRRQSLQLHAAFHLQTGYEQNPIVSSAHFSKVMVVVPATVF